MSEEVIKIFYSYSRKDLDMRNTLEDHLSALREANKISTWHDLQLEAGTEWEPTILNKLNTADIILLLVSRNFIASKYCYGTELKRAIIRHNEGTARIIPIILRPCDWNHPDVPFSKLNVLPTHAKAITSWTDAEEAFTIVAQQIRETVDQLRVKKVAEQQIERERLQAVAARLRQQELEQQQALEKQQAAEVVRLRQQAAQTAATDELASEKGVDYGPLRDLLKAGQWRQADQETADRMCEVMGRQQEGQLKVEDVQKFPCTDLYTIEQLWVKYSKGKFGFSVQKKIWQKCGSPTAYNAGWERFGEVVGWKNKGFLGMKNKNWKAYKEFTFDTSAPPGHLPGCCVEWWGRDGGYVGNMMDEVVGCVPVGCFFSRVETCRL